MVWHGMLPGMLHECMLLLLPDGDGDGDECWR